MVGQGGWQQFKFLFGGGNNVIYAVNQQGQLLRYVDASQTGGGDVSSPQVIGQVDVVVPVSVHWLEQHHLCGQSAGSAALLQGCVADGRWRCQLAGNHRAGWMAAVRLPFGGGNGVIYAAEKALNPADNYEIAGTLTTAPVRCLAERTAVNQATQSVNAAKQIVKALQLELQNAPPSQKPEL